jgi:diguanylate cyclase (GGDEF)-like protein
MRPDPAPSGQADFWHSAIDSLTAHIAVLDDQGRILAVNAAWRRFASNNGSTEPDACIGVNYLAVCDRALAGENGQEGAAAAEGIRAVFAGRRREFSLPYPCHSPKKKRWFMLRVTRFEGPGPACVVIAHENITAPRAAQIRAAEAAKKLESANLGLRQQAADLERAEALESGSNRILELIARNELLNGILHEIALLVERQEPGCRCAVVRSRNERIEVAATPTFAAELRERLESMAAAASGLSHESSLNGLIQAVGFSNGPDLHTFRFVRVPSQSGDLTGSCLAVARPGSDTAPPLSPVLTRAASLAAIALDHAALYEKLSFQAGHDALTEVPNRLLFQERLQEAVAGARNHNRSFGVCMVDLDRFKQVNDLYGHRFGDGLLRQVAHRILDCVRPGDTVARLGGDEFAIILDNLPSPEKAGQIVKRIVSALNTPFSVFDKDLRVTGSVGFSIYPDDAGDPAALVRNADTAMYRCKNQGRNMFQRYNATMGIMAMERLTIEQHLRGAVHRGELEVHYQLQYDLNRNVSGMEALVRWNNPVLGIVSPGTFIPIAEDTGMITEIGAFVLREACRQNVEWRQSGLIPARIAVNVSTVQLVRHGFADYVAAVLAETGLDPELLELEITESAMITSMSDVIHEMKGVRELGVKISIDDFGTGYSSLSYLQNLPVDAIKIDRSFVRELDTGSASGGSVVRAIIALAHSLKLMVVAEGVETRAQFDALSALRCDIAQGYLLHRPLPAPAVAQLLAQTRTELAPPACEASSIECMR